MYKINDFLRIQRVIIRRVNTIMYIEMIDDSLVNEMSDDLISPVS